MSRRGLGRRAVLAGAAAWLAAPAVLRAAAAEPLEAILAASGLGGVSGFALADAGSGEFLEAHRDETALPPASVAKIVTALYALDALGPEHRFRTEIRAAGTVEGGALKGDLVLAGGGDPLIDTDALGEMAGALRERGLSAVEGRLLVAVGALPAVAEIDGGQPEEAGYNPTISGMNLNFNRVFLTWEPGSEGPSLRFSAPGKRFEAEVEGVRAELVDGGLPRHRFEDGREVWSLPRGGVGGRGSEWLPVRAPGVHVGEVFRRLAGAAGLALPEAEVVADVAVTAPGRVLASRESEGLERTVRGMLGYSTNLTAEVVGLRAGQARGAAPEGLAASGAAMTDWARARFGLGRAVFVNHSGLSDATRLTAAEQVAVLMQAAEGGLPGLLRPRPILDAQRQPVEMAGVEVVSKTGTMDFISALAGYMTGRRRLAFAIFAADAGRRAGIRPEERAKPPGAAAWAGRARAQEQALLRRWAAVYG